MAEMIWNRLNYDARWIKNICTMANVNCNQVCSGNYTQNYRIL